MIQRSRLTASQAIQSAASEAKRLNVPWSEEVVAKELLFFGNWKVISQIPGECARTIFIIERKTKTAHLKQVHYTKRLADNN